MYAKREEPRHSLVLSIMGKYHLESSVKTAILEFLKPFPQIKVDTIFQSGMNKKGIADLVGCLNGEFIAIEVKLNAKKQVSHNQYVYLSGIEEANGIAVVVNEDNLDLFKWFVNQRLRNKRTRIPAELLAWKKHKTVVDLD